MTLIKINQKLTRENIFDVYIEIIKAREQHQMNLAFKENRIRMGIDSYKAYHEFILQQREVLLELLNCNENINLKTCPTDEIGETSLI